MSPALLYLLKALSLIPSVLAEIDALHSEKDLVTKTQLARDSLAVTAGVAADVLPDHDTATVQAVSTAVSSAIATAVAAQHAIANPTAAS